MKSISTQEKLTLLYKYFANIQYKRYVTYPPPHTHTHKQLQVMMVMNMAYSRACSLFSPHEKQCPNCESANSCKPPDAATLK